MTVVLGKRKRRARLEEGSDDASGDDATAAATGRLQALFQKHFEAQYEPLEIAPIRRASSPLLASEVSSDGTEDVWEGISEKGDEETAVEIITHAAVESAEDLVPSEERKTFMSNKPPSLKSAASVSRKKPPEASEDTTIEANLLKNDLALQRLLQESHLVPSQRQDAVDVSGKARQRTLDLRMQSLGAKGSLLEQKKMPMAHRVGIARKKKLAEDERRKEARENDVVLEKVKRKAKSNPGRRDRGVGAPSVGKFRGGTLKLSKKDVESIQGSEKGRGKGMKGRGRRK